MAESPKFITVDAPRNRFAPINELIFSHVGKTISWFGFTLIPEEEDDEKDNDEEVEEIGLISSNRDVQVPGIFNINYSGLAYLSCHLYHRQLLLNKMIIIA